MTIQVTDNGKPTPQTDNKLVIVNVPRDLYRPTFTNLPVVVNISESANIGDLVYTVIGSDQDKQVRESYKIYTYFNRPRNASVV